MPFRYAKESIASYEKSPDSIFLFVGPAHADATKAKLDRNPLDGAEFEKNIREVFNLDKALVPRAKKIRK